MSCDTPIDQHWEKLKPLFDQLRDATLNLRACDGCKRQLLFMLFGAFMGTTAAQMKRSIPELRGADMPEISRVTCQTLIEISERHSCSTKH